MAQGEWLRCGQPARALDTQELGVGTGVHKQANPQGHLCCELSSPSPVREGRQQVEVSTGRPERPSSS